MLLLQIETKAAVEAAGDITRVSGVDVTILREAMVRDAASGSATSNRSPTKGPTTRS